MKISLNWVRQFIDFELPPVNELVEKIGAQLGAVEEVEDLGAKYQGVLVAKVVSCEPHENSDHLNICLINDGSKAQGVERDKNGYVQVVCGAPNVCQGLTVAWLPPGSTVPESVGKDPFVLGSRELRGVMSNGMLASPRELALGDSHEGILEIDKEVEPGSDFAPVYKLDDYVIDIENKMFTHRPDCFGVLGVAREIAGILGREFKSPEWYQLDPVVPSKEADLPLTVTNDIPGLVRRFSAVTLADVQIAPSPIWLQVALAKIGQKSISNVVDLTNFYMLVTGQPLHAYDYDKVRALTGGKAAEITVRHPKQGEKIRLINGKEIEPRAEAMMIASGDHLIGVGGVMGGYDTEVDENTRNIILEAANFDMYNIRRTSMAHGLFTDAVTRFNKGQSPLQTLAVLAKITGDVQKIAGAKVASDVTDQTSDFDDCVLPDGIHQATSVSVTADFINRRLGLKLNEAEISTLLTNVEIRVEHDGNGLDIFAPFWRTDIEEPEDVVEEVGRLYGFDKLPLELPRRSIKPAAKNPMFELKRQVRETLSKAGANEVLTYSFVHGDLLKKAGQDPGQAFRLSNALSPDLQHYRLSLTPSLLDKVHQNIKADYDQFTLFEIGKSHVHPHVDDRRQDEAAIMAEYERLSVVIAKSQKAVSNKQGAAFYEAKKYLTALLSEIGILDQVKVVPYDPDTYIGSTKSKTPMYDVPRTASLLIGDYCLGEIGEYRSSVRKALKLPDYCAGFELDTSLLLKYSNAQKAYHPLPRFPKVTQDISLEMPAGTVYGDLYGSSEQALQSVLPAQTVANFQPLDIYQPENSDKKRFTFRLEIASYERTMNDAEVSKLLEIVAAAAKDKFGAERI